MRDLTLADSTRFACDWCGAANGILTFNLTEADDIGEVVRVFNDPRKTEEITFTSGDAVTLHEGYNRLEYVCRNGWPTGGILVAMRKEET